MSQPSAAPSAAVPGFIAPRSHLHLWTLADGTGLHAPYAEMTVEPETMRLCCHLCGRWFVSLGSHVRVHGHTANSYRHTMGLCRTTALTSAVLSTSIAGRQSAGYRRDPQVRKNLEDGRAARMTPRTPTATQSAVTDEPEQRIRRRRAALAAGRATVATQRKHALATMLDERGYTGLHDFLRQSYAEGADLAALARSTGLGRARLRREIEAAGITVRAVGHNTLEAKRARTQANDAEAARRVGSDDIRSWLTNRQQEGWSVARLAGEVGRSTPWVTQRLDHLDPPFPPASQLTHAVTSTAV